MSMWMNFARGANSESLPVIAVVEAGADRDDQVGLVHRVVRRAGAVHAEHPEPRSCGAGNAPSAIRVQVTGKPSVVASSNRSADAFGADDAAAHVEDRPARIRERLGGEPDLLLVALGRRLVAGQMDVRDGLVGDVGARRGPCGMSTTTGPGRPVRAMWNASCDRARDLERVLDHEAVLDDRHRDADRVGLLEAVGAEQSVRTWPVRNTTGTESIIASQIGVTRFVAPGPLVPMRHADLAGRLRVALGGVTAACLVADEDVADTGVVEARRRLGGWRRRAARTRRRHLQL